MKVEVLVFEGCPHADASLTLVKKVFDSLATEASVKRVEIDTPEKAAESGFLGSPSVRVNGEDIERRKTVTGSLCCRTYLGSGVPPEWMIEAGVVRALEPTGVLFLCVANSARSQIAEGIARSLAPKEIKIMSAGSHPKSVRPEAILVLKEIGIDISDHRSKNVPYSSVVRGGFTGDCRIPHPPGIRKKPAECFPADTRRVEAPPGSAIFRSGKHDTVLADIQEHSRPKALADLII